jgi:hypothetical protein
MIGGWNGNMYINEYLGIQITVPANWSKYDFITNMLHGSMSEWVATLLAAGTLEDTLDWYIEDGIISDEFWELAEEYDTYHINVMAAVFEDRWNEDNFTYSINCTFRVAFDNGGFTNIEELYNAYVLLSMRNPSFSISSSTIRIGNYDWHLVHEETTDDWGSTFNGSFVTVIDGITVGISAFVSFPDSVIPEYPLFTSEEMLSWVTSLS